MPETMKVKATRLGHYELQRKKPEAVFEVKPGEFSAVWMEPVGNVPDKFKAEVDGKIEALKNRPTFSEVQRRADAAAIASTRLAVAQGVRDGILDLEAQKEAQKEAQRAQHVAAHKEASSQPSSDGLEAGASKGSGKKS